MKEENKSQMSEEIERKTFTKGDIVYIRDDVMSQYIEPCEEKKDRPAIIVSNDTGNRYGSVIRVAPLTTRAKRPLPTHVIIASTGKTSYALCESIFPVKKEDVCLSEMAATGLELECIDVAIAVTYGLASLGPNYKIH